MSKERMSWLLGVAAVCLPVVTAQAAINLEYRTSNPWMVGETVQVGLYAISDDPSQVQTFSAVRVVFDWDPAFLALEGVNQAGAVGLLSSGFPADDTWGLNEDVPPHDGDGLYQALAMFGEPVETTPEGVLVTTFLFTALQETPGTPVDILVEGGDPAVTTLVTDGQVPGLEVTGTLTGATVTIVPEPAALALLVCGGLALLRRRG